MSIPALLGAARVKADIGLAAFGVLIALADHHNGTTGRCFPSQATLATRARITVRSAQRALAELETATLIKILPGEGSGHGSRSTDAYVLKFPFVYPPDYAGATLRPANSDSMSEEGDTESYQEGKKKEEEDSARTDDIEGVEVQVAVDLIWQAVGDMGRKRSSKPKIEKALLAALRRRPRDVGAEDHLKRIFSGIRAYLASDEARKQNGQFEHGAHRTLIDDVWASWADDGASTGQSAGSIDPDVGTLLEPGPRLQRYWMDTDRQGLGWDSARGPRPGMIGCRVSAEMQREFGYAPFRSEQAEEPAPVGEDADEGPKPVSDDAAAFD